MQSEVSYGWLIAIALIGAVLILLSVIIYVRRDRARLYEHLSRSLVQVGLAAVASSVAFLIYNSNIATSKENDRLVAAQSFKRAVLQYGTAAFQLRSSRFYCDIYTDEMQNQIAQRKSNFDPTSCREATIFATKASLLLPGIESLFSQASKGSRSFPVANYLGVFLTDGDTALRGRVPAIIETNIGAYLARGRVKSGSSVTTRFADAMYDLQQNADAIAAIFCILANSISKSWKHFDNSVEALERGLSEDVPVLYPAFIKDVALKTPFQSSDCAHVRDELEKMLPATGGGNGGGNGG